jgi:hypothetical protein
MAAETSFVNENARAGRFATWVTAKKNVKEVSMRKTPQLIPLLLSATAMLLPGLGEAATTVPEKDRAAILSMAGEFKVSFNFHETLTIDKSREPSPDEKSGAHEKVLVVEDRGDYISLQHLLVVDAEGQQMVVKHWRQDWQYQPKHLTVYRGFGVWEREKLKARDVKGQWSQTVLSVDDSPRYGGIGAWRHVGEVSYWDSAETWRPLPRRESDQRKLYDVLVGRNRHTIIPTGWVHEQDNYKLDLNESGNRIIAHETGFNTYERTTEYDFRAADTYWKETEAFWTAVHDRWTKLLKESPSITLKNDARAISRKVLGMADELREGKYASVEEALMAFNDALDAALAGADEEEAPETK